MLAVAVGHWLLVIGSKNRQRGRRGDSRRRWASSMPVQGVSIKQ
ncbi:hypothetical protein [Anabaena azotica]|nr:hypothetical protein [Anabaena azotica]